MSKRQLLLLSSSKVHGFEYLEFAAKDIQTLLKKNNVSRVLFVPYALKDYDDYVSKVSAVLNKWDFKVDGIHKFPNPEKAVMEAQAFFIGGGNTFRLLKTLYEVPTKGKQNILELIRGRVLNEGIPYIGASAGTNVATKSINTTNDMPIVYPPSFEALKLVPFNINPHYLDPDPNSKHKGETREERIIQYLEEDEASTVLGLREGCSLSIDGDKIILKGVHKARLFLKGSEPKEIENGSDLSFLLKE